MAIVLDHTIVPAKDKVASAEFFADIFGLTVKPGEGYFAQVQINESLTFDFAERLNRRVITTPFILARRNSRRSSIV